MPTLDYVQGNIGDADLFSRFDLQNAYWQLPLDKKSKKYTVINISEGLSSIITYRLAYLLPVQYSSVSFRKFFLAYQLQNVLVDVLVLTKAQVEHLDVVDKVYCLKRCTP